jgi:hypothetical protein
MATDLQSLTIFNYCRKLSFKIKIGSLRTAGRHTFVRQQKYAKVPSPCGGHLPSRVSVALNL